MRVLICRRAHRIRVLAAFCALASSSALPTNAIGDEYNYQHLLVGLRSSGMGGADTAFSDAVTGPYYNPAGLPQSGAELISISLSAYRFDLSGFAEIEARGDTAGRAAGLQFTSIPLSFGLTTRLGDAGLDNHTLAFNFFVEDNNIGGSRVDVRIPGVADLFLRVRRSDQQTIELSSAWGARWRWLSVGAGLAYQLRTETVLSDQLISLRDSITYRLRSTQALHGSLLGRVGIIAAPIGGLRIGASLATMNLPLHSTAVVSQVQLRTGTTAELEPSRESEMQYRAPWRLRLGLGYELEDLRVSADLTFYTAIDRYEIIPNLIQAEGRTLVNWNVGAEFPLFEGVVARVGAFSNFAASPPPSAEIPTTFEDPSRLPHVNYYGGTLGATLLSGASSMDAALVYQYGTGEVPAEAARGFDPVRGHVVVFMLGGSYNFDESTEAEAEESDEPREREEED